MNALEKLQELLRDLFQLDMADLDFGLYRLLHLKRHEIEAFLTEQLPKRVNEAFQVMAGQEFKDIEKDLAELRGKLRENLGEDALLENGEVNPEYRKERSKTTRKLIEDYEAIRGRIQSIKVTEAQQAEVFNHLYTFFSRYYEGGDFIPKRRYGSRETYAVPYNGEEVFFHWANKDQHYVKTGENFKDYAFTVNIIGGSYQIRFVLTEASLPPGNTKGDARYFFPLPNQASLDEKDKIFRLSFHYRLPTEQEVITHGKNSRFQESVLQSSLESIFKSIPNPLLINALVETVDQKDDQEISLLLKRLRHFCRRNTTDYFIHKNLQGFLKRELEFYLKDQVLHLADLEGDFEGKRRTLRVIRILGKEIITFLAQLEDVQKRLFEKKKFVIRTDYLAPVKEVPKELWDQILKNKNQIRAWQDLFAINPHEKINKKFLEDHPTLVINTIFFAPGFIDKFLGSFSDLDGVTDGLLFHSENYQTLNILKNKYHQQVQCIHIDPPYNTQTSGFVYKNNYQHSSWLAMMEDRITTSLSLMGLESSFLCHIDENEYERLSLLFERFSVPDAGTIVWDKRNPMNAGRGVATQHEYIIWRSFQNSPLYLRNENIISMLQRASEIVEKYKGPTEDAQKEYASWVDNNPNLTGGEKAYRYLDETGLVYQSVSLRAPEPRTDPKFHIPLIHPVTKEPCSVPPNGFSRTPETLQGMIATGEIIFGKDETTQPRQKVILREVSRRQITSLIQDGRKGKADVDRVGLDFPYCHPVSLYEELIAVATKPLNHIVVDFFAGSGTSGHATINLNRQDGGGRKFILVEMANYFDTVLLPRIQKIVYTPVWKDGKPKRLPTEEEIDRSPRLIKILRLESYEDALHNLATEKTLKREEKKAKAYKENVGADGYRLSYLVRLPLEANSSMLNISALEHPFNYQIEVLTEQGPKTETVDLVETFNFLYGLHVQRLEKWENKKDNRFYKVVKGKDRKEKNIMVLWRDMKDLDPKIERQFLETRFREEGFFDEILINGDSATPGVKSLDGIFKRRLEEGER